MTLAADLFYDAPSNARATIDCFNHEQRYLLTEDQADAFLEAARPHTEADPWDPERPISYARTTYFDDEALSYFRSGQDSASSGSVTKRLRVREYALARHVGEVPIYTDLCFLELKQHARDVRRKLRLQASRRLIQALLAGRGTLPPTDDEPLLADGSDGSFLALSAIRRELNHQRLSARLATWYRRVCLRQQTGAVRITLDAELLFLWPGPLATAGEPACPGDQWIGRGPSRVLEIKLQGEAPDWLLTATAELKPAHGFSKYQYGMQFLSDAFPGLAPSGAGPDRDPAPALDSVVTSREDDRPQTDGGAC